MRAHELYYAHYGSSSLPPPSRPLAPRPHNNPCSCFPCLSPCLPSVYRTAGTSGCTFWLLVGQPTSQPSINMESGVTASVESADRKQSTSLIRAQGDVFPSPEHLRKSLAGLPIDPRIACPEHGRPIFLATGAGPRLGIPCIRHIRPPAANLYYTHGLTAILLSPDDGGRAASCLPPNLPSCVVPLAPRFVWAAIRHHIGISSSNETSTFSLADGTAFVLGIWKASLFYGPSRLGPCRRAPNLRTKQPVSADRCLLLGVNIRTVPDALSVWRPCFRTTHLLS